MNDTPTLTPELIAMAIDTGMLDAALPALRESVRKRLDIIEKRKAGELNKGDEFLIKDCSPKKWNGELVRFEEHDGMWLVCTVVVTGKKLNLRTSHVGTIFPGGM